MNNKHFEPFPGPLEETSRTFATEAEAHAFILGFTCSANTDQVFAAIDRDEPEAVNIDLGDEEAVASYYAALKVYEDAMAKLDRSEP